MALSGYIFPTPLSIMPYLEQPRIGPTSLLCRSLAQRLRCHVIAGYPEALPEETAGDEHGADEESETAADSSRRGGKVMKEGEGVGWNSAMVVGPGGEWIGNYRKTFRFETDKNWAREGELPAIVKNM
jgi:protein N-terminal amidase